MINFGKLRQKRGFCPISTNHTVSKEICTCDSRKVNCFSGLSSRMLYVFLFLLFYLVCFFVMCVKFIMSAFYFMYGCVFCLCSRVCSRLKEYINIKNKLSAFFVSRAVGICHQYLVLANLLFSLTKAEL